MSDVMSSLPPGLGWRDGLRQARRHLLLWSRMQRQGARWLRYVYPTDLRQLERARRKFYKAWVARQLALDLRKMEKSP